VKSIHHERPPLDLESRENYIRRFGLDKIEASRLEKFGPLLDYKGKLDREVTRLRRERASYTDRRIKDVCIHFGIHISDLVDKSAADLIRGILDAEDYITALRRAKEAQ
jgi:hypothetical protein